jgi:hypothetical protein
MIRRCVLLALLLLLAAPARSLAASDPQLPPKGKIFAGVAMGEDFGDYTRRTGRTPHVWEHFILINEDFRWAIKRARAARTRLLVHLSTAPGQNTAGSISPGRIAAGGADAWLLSLRAALVRLGEPSYVRFLGEMNNCHNAYAPLNCNGSSRGRAYSAKAFVAAWKRTTVIMRGGNPAAVDAAHRRLRQKPLGATAAQLVPAPIAMVWSPMTGGSPMVSSLDPRHFWPGRAWTDWTATSFYSRYPEWRWLTPFYERYSAKQRVPFMVAEWAMWVNGDPGFVRKLFSWTFSHPRTRMLIYNQGNDPNGPFRLRRFPGAAAALRSGLANRRFDFTDDRTAAARS